MYAQSKFLLKESKTWEEKLRDYQKPFLASFKCYMIFDNILNAFVKYLIKESAGERLLIMALLFKLNNSMPLGWFCSLI